MLEKVYPKDVPSAVFFNCDYKQLEVRVAAWLSRDPKLIEACKGDIHTTVNNRVFRFQIDELKACDSINHVQEVTRRHMILAGAYDYYRNNQDKFPVVADLIKFCIKYLRDECKKITFGVMYGREAFSLSQVLRCSEKEAQRYINLFFEEYNLLYNYLEGRKKLVQTKGFLETPFGRRRRFPFMTPEMENRVLKQTINFEIQSAANDICLQSYVNLSPALREHNYGSVKFPVHDAIAGSLKLTTIRPALELIRHHMENTIRPVDVDVKFEIDQSIGPSYGKQMDVEVYLKELGYEAE